MTTINKISDAMLEIVEKELIEKLYKLNIEFNSDNILTIVSYAMEIVELHKLDGSSKKRLVIDLIKKLNSIFLQNEKQQLVNQMLESGIIENSIDIIITASKGRFVLNSIQEETKEVLEKVNRNCMMSCFSGGNNKK
jgi:spore coat polysaccharide biosynthesis protein SpsF (cytidylyltransferase family)